MATQPDLNGNDGWIEWAGGECPVDLESLVNVKTADGDPAWETEAAPAGVFAESLGDLDLNWWHSGNLSHDWRIIAYRVVSA